MSKISLISDDNLEKFLAANSAAIDIHHKSTLQVKKEERPNHNPIKRPSTVSDE